MKTTDLKKPSRRCSASGGPRPAGKHRRQGGLSTSVCRALHAGTRQRAPGRTISSGGAAAIARALRKFDRDQALYIAVITMLLAKHAANANSAERP